MLKADEFHNPFKSDKRDLSVESLSDQLLGLEFRFMKIFSHES